MYIRGRVNFSYSNARALFFYLHYRSPSWLVIFFLFPPLFFYYFYYSFLLSLAPELSNLTDGVAKECIIRRTRNELCVLPEEGKFGQLDGAFATGQAILLLAKEGFVMLSILGL